ncbi:MAG: 16S rRNA (cytosine(1402)-N(4))-methyltransferase RsmH [Clostridia bacterium]|nr:16S rRNA (cytosine(1402)-N(4))-methyltransferase RsmH [Clostridia bacterium]
MEFQHISVLLHETIEGLRIRPEGIYLDGTAGGGGHSKEIAKRLTLGRLIAVDQDPDAIAVVSERLNGLPATPVKDNFSHIKKIVKRLEIPALDGVLLDLGVSSHQLDVPERGFSFHSDAPLDMRMSQNGFSAADLVNQYPEEEIAKILWLYGEEKFSRKIAQAIVRYRAEKPISTTVELAEIIKNSVPAAVRREGHPARKSFQAIRIAVNGELDILQPALQDAFDTLKCGGRLAVITFHSLEDRIVKQTFAGFCKGCVCPPDFPVCKCGRTPKGRLVNTKPIVPSAAELEQNPRSRSAKLRIVEKIKENTNG